MIQSSLLQSCSRLFQPCSAPIPPSPMLQFLQALIQTLPAFFHVPPSPASANTNPAPA